MAAILMFLPAELIVKYKALSRLLPVPLCCYSLISVWWMLEISRNSSSADKNTPLSLFLAALVRTCKNCQGRHPHVVYGLTQLYK
jgi:hypothetical protein